MNSLFEYLLTGSGLLLVLVLGYTIFLRNHKLLRFTRFYLLGSLLLCLFFPLLPKIASLLPYNILEANSLSISLNEQYLPALVLSPQEAESTVSMASLLLILYATGCGIALLVHLIRLVNLRKMLQQLNFHPTPEGYLLAHTEGSIPTFSFFHYLAINKAQASTEEELQLVLQHEKAHARQHHSADVLLIELAQVIFWFHSVVYILGRALRQTHEHLADATVITNTAAEPAYVALMAKHSLQAAGLPLVSTFFQSFTINRIRMIKKSTPANWHWRIAASMLLTTSLTVFIACDEQQDLSENLIPPPPPPMEIPDEAQANSPIEIFDVAEVEAQPVNGMEGLYQHLQNNISYPKEAHSKKIEGTAYIRFVVDKQGNVESAEAVKGRELGHGLDEEAIRVIKASKWSPARQRGKAVKQRKILPVKFMLDKAPAQKSTNDQTSMLFKDLLKTPKKEAC